MMFAQTTVEAPKKGASRREAEISVARVAPPTSSATSPSLTWRVTDTFYRGSGRGRGLLGRIARLVRRDRDLLGRDLARNDRDVDLVLVLAIDEDRRAGAELAPEDEVGQRVLDVALDRAAQRPGAHRRVVALLDEELLRGVRELDRGLVLADLVAQPLHHQIDDRHDLFLRQL